MLCPFSPRGFKGKFDIEIDKALVNNFEFIIILFRDYVSTMMLNLDFKILNH